MDDPDAAPLSLIARPLGFRTNNVAEYAGTVLALREARRLGATQVDLRLDSKLIVEQLNGRWRVKDAKLKGLFAEARQHLAAFARWSAVHEPRARNRAADALANLALDDPLAAARLEADVHARAAAVVGIALPEAGRAGVAAAELPAE
jgi:ribonuclease HI